MKRSGLLFCICLLAVSCIKSQERSSEKINIGGPCEGCEAIYEFGNKTLTTVDTLPGFSKASIAVKLSGIVYEKDGRTPAKDVILYFYQTDEHGIYPTRTTSQGWEKRHGFLRGWVKTDASGSYTIYTSRPASYPNTRIPQHIHVTVKEADKNEYYIEDFFFSDDPNLTDNIRTRKNARGGSGVVTLRKGASHYEAVRDIILGLHIPQYP